MFAFKSGPAAAVAAIHILHGWEHSHADAWKLTQSFLTSVLKLAPVIQTHLEAITDGLNKLLAYTVERKCRDVRESIIKIAIFSILFYKDNIKNSTRDDHYFLSISALLYTYIKFFKIVFLQCFKLYAFYSMHITLHLTVILDSLQKCKSKTFLLNYWNYVCPISNQRNIISALDNVMLVCAVFHNAHFNQS